MRNTADSLVYQTEKVLKDQADSFSGEEKEQVETNLTALKDVLGGADLEAIRRATDTLAASSQELGKKLYESAAASGASQTGAGATGGNLDDEVVDAEVVDDEGK